MVGIVIVHYTGREDTLECLASVCALTGPEATVYLVDQGVGDGTPQAVRESYPTVHLLENRENLGFAGGANVGIRAALTDGADHVLLLNNDVTLAPDVLDRLTAYAESEDAIGIVGPVVLGQAASDVICTGCSIDWRGQAWQSYLAQDGKYFALTPDTFSSDVGYVNGCAMLIKRAVFDRIGMFDERFFLYYEEADLCARAREAGFAIRCVGSARIWHKISRATGTGSPLTLYYMRRNMLLYLWKRRRWLGGAAAALDSVRLALVWLLQSVWQRDAVRRQLRQALHAALYDAARGRWGRAEYRW